MSNSTWRTNEQTQQTNGHVHYVRLMEFTLKR